MALIIRMDGSKEEVEVPAEDRLKFYQDIVGGYIDALPYRSGSDYASMIINDEGKFLPDCERNDTATQLMAGQLFHEDYISGNVILVTEKEFD